MSPTVVAAASVLSAAEQAEQLKQDGNVYFKKERFAAAIDAYTEAITLCPNVPVYWTNRALCHRKRNDWVKVEWDCRRAIELDTNSVKAHYMLGLALLQREEYAGGVKELEKALDLGRGANPKSYMVEEIWQELAKAKYLEWEHISTERTWKLQSLKEACENALNMQYQLDASRGEYVMGEGEAKNTHMEQLKSLEELFRKAAEADTPTEVPDYLCCKITLDIFRDPVITPSGVTYERAVIIDHLQKVGNFDPVTREPLEQHQLVPNLAIKEAVQAFLKYHSWAYRMD
ncbi:E3 ubiquitin-protein ligase CHIP isoform X1 [Macadamia integrifolia]|uniref:E3 ubiquitin-protein ligase CHIP isoform X1 n=1 Tax=Macadamia integrifolia TaxID=60698 RepID=UPI001C4F958E|nr:E3 ubiquitin-protein ligase CHIP isoform X1 [Macadamia integrifolia]XP_042492018.1 E3 ubiquitin-protein ligase CHIP isoform X1 [Macadamia integrifolia]